MRQFQVEERYRMLYEGMADALFVYPLNPDGSAGSFIEVNEAACQRLGYRREQLLTMRLDDIAEPGVNLTEMGERLRADGDVRFTQTHITNDGQRIPVEIHAQMMIFDGKPSVVAIARDASTRCKIEDAFYFVAQRGWQLKGADFLNALSTYLCHALDVHYAFISSLVEDDVEEVDTVAYAVGGVSQPNIRYELVNTPCERVIGRKLCCYPRNVQQLFPLDVMLREMEAESYAGIPIWDSDGLPLGLIGVIGRKPFQDPSLVETILQIVAIRAAHELDRLRAEQAVQEAELFARSTLDALSAHIAIVDSSGVILSVNQAWRDFAGANGSCRNVSEGGNYLATCRQAAGEDVESAHQIADGIQQVLDGALDYFEMEYPCHLLHEERWFTVRVTPFPGGGAPRAVIAHEDITQRKQVEIALRQSEERFSIAFRNSPVPMVITTVDGEDSRFIEVNDAYLNLVGCTWESLRGKRLLDAGVMISCDHHSRRRQALDQVGTYPLQEAQISTRSGDIRDVLISAQRIQLDGQPCDLELILDMTDLKRTEKALLESEARYRAVSELMSDYAFALGVAPDGELTCEWVTESYTRLIGFTPEEVNQQSPFILYHPDDREQSQRDVERVLQGEEVTNEYRALTKSGEMRWLRLYRRPVWDEQQQRVVRIYGAGQDITAHKVAEATALENKRLETILRKEKEWNAALQRMMKILSHEFRNPLAAIAASSDMLRTYYDRMPAEKRFEKLDTIFTQAQEINRILDDVVAVVRGAFNKSVFQPRPVNLAHLCEVSIKETQETMGSAHQLTFVTDGRVREVQVDETLVTRVLVNLLSNAIKYSPEGSEIRLQLCLVDDQILLQVIDQGVGIPYEDQPYIFDTFFRARNASSARGTGLGLSIVKDCVELHNGVIEFESAPGRGSVFNVWLPLIPV